MPTLEYNTRSGIHVTRKLSSSNFKRGLGKLLEQLDSRRGVYFSSGYEYPGRYSRWDIAAICPPLEIVGYERRLEFRPLNERGAALCRMLQPILANHPDWESFTSEDGILSGTLKPLSGFFSEEERSRHSATEDPHLFTRPYPRVDRGKLCRIRGLWIQPQPVFHIMA